MKKIFTMITALALAFAANAQTKHYAGKATHRKVVPRQQTEAEIRLSLENGIANKAQASSQERDILFSEDFANGFNGNNAFGAWSNEDSGGNSIWMVADANSPAGAYSSSDPALASTSAGNGWIIFDCDLYQGGEITTANPAEAVSGYLTSPVMDFSSAQSAILTFEHYFRFCCYDAKPMFLEVTNDAGLNWYAFDVAPDFLGGANDASDNPLLTTIDISALAAGQPGVQIRFAWQPDGNVTHSHYYWGLDDVTISTNPAVNDIRVIACTNGDIFNDFQFRAIPLEQAIPADADGMIVGTIYTNAGTAAHQANIKVEILDESMNVLAADSADVEILPNSLMATPNDVVDSVFIASGWQPTVAGTYFARCTVRTLETEETPADNSAMRKFTITDDEFGHDDPAALSTTMEPLSGTGTSADPFPETGYGNYLTVYNDGSTAYGATIRFGTASTTNTPITILLIKQATDYNLTDGEYIAGSEYSIDPSWTPNFSSQTYPIYLPFDDGAAIEGGSRYFVGIQTTSEGTDRLSIKANREFDEDFSTGVWAETVDGDFIWFFGLTSVCDYTPGVRLVLSERIGVEEINTIGLNSFTVNPNPARDMATLNFDLQGSHYIAYEVRDITGKLMDWKNIGQFSGANNYQLDVSSYPVGQYVVRLVIDGEHLVPTQLQVTK